MRCCMSTYTRHTPEKTVLYQVLARTWPGVVRDYREAEERISRHVLTEFDRYFRCGILQHGFVRLQCPKCDLERVVAYSCKCRGICFSCNARRMEQTANRIEQEVWPLTASTRQWVLSFPFQVRYWLARNPELLGAVNKAVCQEISDFLGKNISSQLRLMNDSKTTLPEVGTGAISFVQFFGSALNLTPHLHILFMDGGWFRDKKGFRFLPVQGFTSESMFEVIYGILRRLDLVFKAFGYVRDDGEGEEPELSEDIPLPFKPRSPKAYRRRGRSPDHPNYKQIDPDKISIEGWCNVKFKWFSLHAGVAIKADDRFGLKKLIRYTSRSAVSPSRLSYVDPANPETSEVKLGLKKAWTDGTSELIFSQQTFTEKIAEIIPPTWFNLTRYHGIFTPGHAWRDFIVPGPQKKRYRCDEDVPPPKAASSKGSRAVAEYWQPWAELMTKTFGINPEICLCGAKMVVQECVTDAEGIAAMMAKLGLCGTPPPLGRVKGQSGELSYLFDGV